MVNDGPGFVVNRVLMPYLREALHLVEDGYRVTDVDAAMRAFGMPRGPFEVMDEVGLGVTANVAAVLGRAFPDRVAPAPQLEALVKEGSWDGRAARGSTATGGDGARSTRWPRGCCVPRASAGPRASRPSPSG